LRFKKRKVLKGVTSIKSSVMTQVITKEELRNETGPVFQKILEELVKTAEPIERPGQNPLYIIEYKNCLYTVVENYFPDISGEKFTYFKRKKLNQR
jgi:hypothetical protein